MIKDKDNVILVNKDNLVMDKLKEIYSTRKVSSLYTFWTLLSTRGENYAKSLYNKATFYRLRKDLISCGISWKDTNIYINTDHKVISFVPGLNSPFLYDYNEPNDEFKEKSISAVKRCVMIKKEIEFYKDWDKERKIIFL